MADVNELISDIDSLPTFPSASAQLVDMLGNNDVSIEDVAEIIRIDEALSIAVLRYANSAAFGTPDRKFDLRESIVRLGRSTLTKIVLEQQAATVFKGGCEAFDLTRERLWRGAIGGAIAAESFAAEHNPDLKDLAFVTGLVRDVGKLVLDRKYGSDYASSVHDKLRIECTYLEAERDAFGTDHAVVGAALCRHWKLPERIASAVECHHCPPTDGEKCDELCDYVHAGDIIALWSGISIGSDGLRYELADHVKTSLRISRRAAERAIASMWDSVGRIEETLGLQTDDTKRSVA
ncbi:MAG: HDOD domain-containing protein [Phycisphaerales bacterium]